MASAITWFKAIFSSVILLLKHLFRLTETETEKDAIAAVSAAEAAVATAEAAMAVTTEAATIAAEYASAAIVTAQAMEQSQPTVAAIAAAEAAFADAEAAADTAFAAVCESHAAAIAAVGVTNHGGDKAALQSQSGYSARKHLTASKRLMQMLAFMRGYLVSMQAPVKALIIIRSQTKRKLIFDNMNVDSREDHIIPSHSRRLYVSLETCFNTVDESPKIVKVDPTYMAHTQSFKANLMSYRAPKQMSELKAGSKSSFRANLRRIP